jgi:ABC-type iron transport system FetAB permease component
MTTWILWLVPVAIYLLIVGFVLRYCKNGHDWSVYLVILVLFLILVFAIVALNNAFSTWPIVDGMASTYIL